MNCLYYSQIKYLGEVSLFWYFWEEFFFNLNKQQKLSYQLHALRVNFCQSLSERFPCAAVKSVSVSLCSRCLLLS